MKQAVTRESLVIATVAAFGVHALALLSPNIFNDGDTFWHIRAGQWMLAHHAVLNHDVFSLALAGKPWDAQEWFSEILLAGSFDLFGWSGVAILTGLAMATAVAMLALYLARYLDPVPLIATLVLAVGCVMPNFLARPHILALPFLTAWVIGLVEASESRSAPHWVLLPVMILWANLHGSFVFGLALILPFAIEAVLAKNEGRGRLVLRWSLFAAAAVVSTLLNPRGFHGLIYPFQLMNVKSLAAVGEWQALDVGTFSPVVLAIAVTLFFVIWRGIRIPAARLALLLALLYLTLLHMRYGMILGIVGAILVAGPIGATLKREQPSSPMAIDWRVAIACFAVLLLGCSALRIVLPIRRSEEPGAPLSALAAVPPLLRSQTVFNNYSFGGFLIWEGIRPLVDSRADFYGDAYLADYWKGVSADPATVNRLFQKYQVAWTLLKPSDPLVAALDHRSGWHRLYSGRYAVVQAGPDASSIPKAAVSARN